MSFTPSGHAFNASPCEQAAGEAQARFTALVMPLANEQRRAARRAEILAAACRCFARDRFHATSMAEIVAEACLSAGPPRAVVDGTDMTVGRA